MRNKIAGVMIALIAGAGGWATGGQVSLNEDQPAQVTEIKVTGIDCSAEDDCRVDYRGGHWYVQRVEH